MKYKKSLDKKNPWWTQKVFSIRNMRLDKRVKDPTKAPDIEQVL